MIVRNKLIRITIPLYAGKTVWVAIGVIDADFDRQVLKLKKRNTTIAWPKELNADTMAVSNGLTDGVTYRLPKGNSLIRIPAYDDFNIGQRQVVVHEFLHAVGHLTRSISLELSDGSEEAFTYLLDYFIGEFYYGLHKEIIAPEPKVKKK